MQVPRTPPQIPPDQAPAAEPRLERPRFEFKFNPDQPHQKAAINAIVDLFDGFQRQFERGLVIDEVFPNLPETDELDEFWLEENLQVVQQRHNDLMPDASVPITRLELDDGVMLEGVSNASHSCPHFTVEMETGTGKTYVYFRTMLELYLRYGLRKFVIVVPSVAILEGVKKAFAVMEQHFVSLYGRTHFKLLEYDGTKLLALRGFASSQFPLVMVMTQQSFNKASNVFYRQTEKLAGERKPFEWVQAIRPIVILDEPQNMGSDKSREAIRTLKPLFVLRYSATHRKGDEPNLVYRLTPVEAFRAGLVKQIEVIGISELSRVSANLVRLEEVVRGKPITAKVRALTLKDGITSEQVFTLKQGDDLAAKSKLEDHKGFRVAEIKVGKDGESSQVIFENEVVVAESDEVLGSRTDVWRAQIEKTVETHLRRQAEMRGLGIKVLTLFFIDRVANFVSENGTIRRLFDETFDRLKLRHEHFAELEASEVRSAYFAKSKNKKTNEEVYRDDLSEKTDGEEAREAFKLIMRDKERLLSFSEPVSFIFAHSALKEGWDNPNVFQICTLNQTASSMKKRQEIGRGLRLCVDQNGDRPDSLNLNILTVVANESYESYVTNLQRNYVEDGESAPPAPKPATKVEAKRRDEYFNSDAFKAFWQNLCRRLEYRIVVDTDTLTRECVAILNKTAFPEPILTVTRGRYVVTDYIVKLEHVYHKRPDMQADPKDEAYVSIQFDDSTGKPEGLGIAAMNEMKFLVKVGDDLYKKSKRLHLRGFKVAEIRRQYGEDHVRFSNEIEISTSESYHFQETTTRPRSEQQEAVEVSDQPVPDFIGRAVEETDLTRATVFAIFQAMDPKLKSKIFKNPEGWTNVFIGVIKEALSEHIAAHVEYLDERKVDLDSEELFPKIIKQPQRELIEGGPKSLYDRVQVDSDVERSFIKESLGDDADNIIMFFKFPPKFKLGLPRIIGNYNPDWAILRIKPDGSSTVELVRETKGQIDPKKMRFANEGRKLKVAKAYFKALGVDYRWVTHETARYWESEPELFSEPPVQAPLRLTRDRRTIAMTYVVRRFHEQKLKGRLRLIKTMYLTETFVGVPLGFEYRRDQNGPFDRNLFDLEREAAQEGIFSNHTDPKWGVFYEPGNDAAVLEEATMLLGDNAAKVDWIINLFANDNSDHIEAVATLFAVWNDALLAGKNPTDTEIVNEAKHEWHPQKDIYNVMYLRAYLEWMRLHKLVPRGVGPKVQIR
jgi:type III restriction enzyme